MSDPKTRERADSDAPPDLAEDAEAARILAEIAADPTLPADERP